MYKSRRKGVSPVVATLLLILVAVAAAVVLYAWVSGLSAKAKSSGTEKTSVAFDIEAANLYYNSTSGSGNVTVYVRNIGSAPIENGTWSLYIIDPDTSAVIAENTSWTFNNTIDIGQIINTAVGYSGSLTIGKYYVVKVVSPQGVTDQIYVKAQKA